MPSKYSPWPEMQSFSRCIHFLKASRYADLGTVIRYWWMADPSACRDWYFHPARNAFNFGNKKKSHGARSGGIRRVRQNSYFFFLQKRRNYCGGMSWGIVMFKTSGRASFLIILFSVSSVLRLYSTFRWCFCTFSLALLLRLLHQRRRLHRKLSLYSKNVWQLLGVCCV